MDRQRVSPRRTQYLDRCLAIAVLVLRVDHGIYSDGGMSPGTIFARWETLLKTPFRAEMKERTWLEP
jgi:hypothetical protein